MDNRSVGRGVLLELFQKDIQMAVRIKLISQASSRKRSHSGSEWLILSRLTLDHPEGFVVPGFLLAVPDEAGSRF